MGWGMAGRVFEREMGRYIEMKQRKRGGKAHEMKVRASRVGSIRKRARLKYEESRKR